MSTFCVTSVDFDFELRPLKTKYLSNNQFSDKNKNNSNIIVTAEWCYYFFKFTPPLLDYSDKWFTPIDCQKIREGLRQGHIVAHFSENSLWISKVMFSACFDHKVQTHFPRLFFTQYYLNFFLIFPLQLIFVSNHSPRVYNKYSAAYIIESWDFSVLCLFCS